METRFAQTVSKLNEANWEQRHIVFGGWEQRHITF